MLRILLMDDDRNIRNSTAILLRQLGYDVTLAASGEEMIALFEKASETGRRFDAVVIDLQVHAGMGGMEAFRAIAALDPDVKAILSTGFPDSPVLESYQTIGFKGVIEKPYTASRLDALLEQVIGAR